MNQRLLIALLTAIGFAAGFGARMLTEGGPAVPPPPAPGTEFVRSSTSAVDSKERRAPSYSDKDRAKLLGEIEKSRREIDDYRKRVDDIANEFERELVQLFNEEQRQKFAAMKKREAERRAKGEKQVAETTTLSDEQIFQLQQQPLWSVLREVALNWRFDRINKDFKLDESQASKVKALLEKRRQNFLALVDSSQPPSIKLSQLAPQAEKLAVPKK